MGMVNKHKFLMAFLGVVVAAVIVFIITNNSNYNNLSGAEKVDQFSGKTVGVMLAWESDYALTARKDLNILRYDQLPDMVMALQHDRIDAIALDALTAKTVLFMTDGLEIVPPIYGQYGYVAAFGRNEKELCDDYDAFLREYIRTDEYQDLQRRISEFDGHKFDGKIIRPTGTGRTITVACNESGFPSTYYDYANDCWVGSDYEPFITWANARNYKVEITGTVYEDMIMGVFRGRYEMIIGFLSELYQDDFDTFGINHSIPLNPIGIYFLVKSKNGISTSYGLYEEF